MDRRKVLTGICGVGITGIAGCSSSDEPTEEDSNDSSTASPDDGGEDASTPNNDVVVDYSTHTQSGATGEYDLPEPLYDRWGWLVVDLEVTSGELNMQEAWFDSFLETEERLYAVAHDSSEVENGIESRGSIREGGRGVMLFDYPPSPQSDVVGWNTSIMNQSVGGTEVITNEPTELYPPVSIEYSVSTATNPDILSNQYASERGNGETWAIVSVEVTEGFLNMEDVWFRSQLTTESRQHSLSHSSQHATRGTWSRGLVKSGNSMNALYLIDESETVQEWGYTEESRQNVDISRS